MAIIFANSYEDPGADRGPSEGEMFFTNLLGGLKTGVENWNQREYARMDRERQLQEQLAAEQRQFGRQKELAEFSSQLNERQDQREEEQLIARELRNEQKQIRAEQRDQNSPAALLALELSRLKVDREKADAEFQKLMRLKNEGLLDKERELALKKTEEQLAQMDRQLASYKALGDIDFERGVQSRRVSNVSIPSFGSVPIMAPGPEDIGSQLDRVQAAIRAKAQSINDPRAQKQFMEDANNYFQGVIDRQTKTAKAKKDEEERVRANKKQKMMDISTQLFAREFAMKPLNNQSYLDMQKKALWIGLQNGVLTIQDFLDGSLKISDLESEIKRGENQEAYLKWRAALQDKGDKPIDLFGGSTLDGGVGVGATPITDPNMISSDQLLSEMQRLRIGMNPQ